MNSFRAAIQSGNGLHPKNPLVRDKASKGAATDDLESVSIPRGESRSANHRDEDRHRLTEEQATARHNGNTHSIDIVNLSGGGAMIHGDFKPNLWDRVDLVLGDGPCLEGAVRWIRGDRIGLEFAHETQIECDADTHDKLLLDVIQRSFPQIKALPERVTGQAVPEQSSSDAGNRTETRHPLIWNGQIHFAHDSHPVRLRNVSSGGALVEVVKAYPIGAEMMLDLGGAGQFFVILSWLHGDQAGLAFKEPFDVTCLAKSRPDVMPQRWERPGFLDDSATSSPWDTQWSRQSLAEMRTDLEGFLKR